jgi:feruloyl-CoA synthase
VVVNSAPWSHSLGANAILHMIVHRGGSLYIDHGQPVAGRFGATIDNLHLIAPTYHNMVPAGWALFADALEQDQALARTFFSRVRVLQYGGAGLPQSVCDRVGEVAVRLTGERITFAAGYGSTETGPTACNVHWINARSGLCGLPTPGTRAAWNVIQTVIWYLMLPVPGPGQNPPNPQPPLPGQMSGMTRKQISDYVAECLAIGQYSGMPA